MAAYSTASPSSLICRVMLSITIFVFLITNPRAWAYIPAQAVNNLTLSSSSALTITWVDPEGVYSGGVSFQLQADTSTGTTTEGALVHFTEASAMTNESTTTPWIAYISCDANETDASMEWDIFTLARDRGAVSALLYTTTAEACLINQEYLQDFEKVLDVFATSNKDIATVIDSQFDNTNSSFYTFNATLLNSSALAVNDTLSGVTLSHKSYLLGVLTARNDSTTITTTTAISSPSSTTTSSSSSSSKKSRAMIAVYVVAGFLSAMVCISIFSVIRRALRPPPPREYEEPVGIRGYGGGHGGGAGHGLTQAIVDSFPLIKFNKQQGNEDSPGYNNWQAQPNLYPKSLEKYAGMDSADDLDAFTLPDIRARDSYASSADESGSFRTASEVPIFNCFHPHVVSSSCPSISGSTSVRASIVDPGIPTYGPVMGDMDEDHCPICLLEFETGDDLRVLPCEGQHKFHQICIDPWLLRVSTSCPLCRKDFDPDAPTEEPTDISEADSDEQPPPTPARYFAFIRLARRRAGSSRESVHGEGTSRMSRVSRGSRSQTPEHVGPGRSREADQTGPGGF